MEPILRVRNITKIYPNGTGANRDISFDVAPRTVHAVVGENGAGKTTLMKILFGMVDAQDGEIVFRGEPLAPRSPHEAIGRGIGMVHQHLMLAPDLTVAENLILGVEPRRGGLFLDTKKIASIARETSVRYRLDVPVDRKIRDLPIGTRQRVEILKALFREAQLLILDEPTAVLTPQESERLFGTFEALKDDGKTILFISHKLDEVARVADAVTVMRDATVVDTRNARDLSRGDIATLMVGREIEFDRIAPTEEIGAPLLRVERVHYTDEEGVEVLRDVSFAVHAGEIVGVAGVEGNGQTELVRSIAGLITPQAGRILIRGDTIAGLSPREIRRRGVAHIPEDRMEDGVAVEGSLRENFIVDRYDAAPFSRGGRLQWREIDAFSRTLIRDFDIRAADAEQEMASLSGGNIQKCVVARELSAEPYVVVASQPTRGVDVGSWEELHRLLVAARDRGRAIFLVSADLDEVIKLSTRILVMYNGEIVARFHDTSEMEATDLGPYMLGVTRQEP
ncbi:MAG: ABC transporter ATP-binding protein [Spirochaetales bacterium]|nr:ABC transporter ATP-binding protein [Spirochaetales bacterium]